jgi:hypothetical protein
MGALQPHRVAACARGARYSRLLTTAPSHRASRPSSAKSSSLPKQRAQGMPGVCATPTALCAKKRKHTSSSHHRYAETIRHSLRDGFNAFLRALPGERAFLSPSSARSIVANLASASRRQNHTTSPSAKRALVSPCAQRPSHPAPDVRDDASAPPDGRETREGLLVICPTAQGKFLCSNCLICEPPRRSRARTGAVGPRTSRKAAWWRC